MRKISRRTVIGRFGAAIVGIASVGTGAGRSTDDVHDALEELYESFVDLEAEVESTVNVLDEMDVDRDFNPTELPDFDDELGSPGFDGFSEDPDFDGEGPSPDFDGGDDTPGLDDVDDDLVINGVPVGQMESLDQVNESVLSQFDGRVIVNGVPLGRASEAHTGTANDSATTAGADVSGGTTNSTANGASNSSEQVVADGVGGDISGNPTGSRQSDSDEQTVAIERIRARTALADVREEVAEVATVLDEIRTSQYTIVRQESQRAHALLDDVQKAVDTTERRLGANRSGLVEPMKRVANQLNERIDHLEELLGDFDDGFGP
ncbi:hypothetical protein EGH21_21150 [Halomicroarcula sp. F13]|uniref:Uncharacterized protein n=1 Tax=Haloarcula rubra TaxID=2487747 RepID=A0AAW4PWI1_9EURY|nr:hypothetical protein [Halomicroarcula rubra]MBX0325536.1 hypothetical protein [Halomicroarcula rubra]